ncbi:hypothetical protein SORBI_3006G089233 [Sorghum bicolor]|uniref:Uncharacterized protein n=1 Tax=Sorghum bicolor TaxID=4558 RepID=A0A1Z5RDW2_SORBI|nr:hypothetical protein SORBI_3006G089233 [Sorghum bicolor]
MPKCLICVSLHPKLKLSNQGGAQLAKVSGSRHQQMVQRKF